MLIFFYVFSFSYLTKFAFNAEWVLIFFHNSTGGVYFSDFEEALEANSAQKYSILGEISDKDRINGFYEFLLEYPELTGYNRWRQRRSPTHEVDSTWPSKGYTPINISWTDQAFGGLVRSSSSTNCFVEGSVGHVNWYYTIGAYIENGYMPNCDSKKDCIPGPGEGPIVRIVKLWMRSSPKPFCATQSQVLSLKYGFLLLLYVILE